MTDPIHGQGPHAPRTEREAPASFAQERLWFLDRMHPGDPAYNVPVAWRVAGALDAAALERALTALSARHQALRTTLAERGGAVVQVVHAPAPFALDVRDLSHRPRAALVRISPAEHWLVLVFHHVIVDGWSLGVFFGELAAAYAAARRGADADLGDAPAQYADYAAWQRESLTADEVAKQAAFWRGELQGEPTLLELPKDRVRQDFAWSDG